MPLLQERFAHWLSQIPENEGNEKVRALLSNPELVEEKMEMRQFGLLESLRSVLPEAWRSLIIASSERQMAEVALFRRWLKEASDEEIKAWGMSRPELELFGDIPALLGRYIDQAYLKQMELADLPGGSSPTPLAGNVGADRVYDIQRKGQEEVEKLPYIAVFPFELGRFSKLVLHLKGKVDGLMSQGKLPKSYSGMPAYLEKMAALYSSHETDPKTVAKMWNRDLAGDANRLVEQGCPMVLIPQATAAVSGDAEKVDVELRLGLRTPQIEAMEKVANSARGVAQEILDQYHGAVESSTKIPPITLTYQPFAFGPNLHWMTRGESTGDKILSHVNAVADVARRNEIPLLEKVFEIGKIDPDAYSQSANLETVLHEVAHSIMIRGDAMVKVRVGSGNRSSIIEELKADTVNMLILDRSEKEGKIAVDRKAQFLAKLGTVCDYMSDSSEELDDYYFYTGVRIIHDLLHAGAVEKGENGKFAIRDAEKGMEVIGKIGNEVLGIYSDLKTDPAAINDYADGIIAMKDDPLVREFIAALNLR